MLQASDFIAEEASEVKLVMRKSDGYISMNKFCSQFEKRFANIIRSETWSDIVKGFSETHEERPTYSLLQGIPKTLTELSGAYLHPDLLEYIATCICPSKIFVVRSLLKKVEEKRNEELGVFEQTKQLRIITRDPNAIGKSGETLSFELLKRYFPALEDCHTDFHASDFYDPLNNIRFVIKTKEHLQLVDYEKITYDDQLRRPKLTVLLSTVDKCKPSLRFFPNILTINVKDFEQKPEFWQSFINESEWERFDEVIQHRQENRMETLLNRLEDMLTQTQINTSVNIAKVLTGGDKLTASFTSVIQRSDESINLHKQSSVVKYIEYKRKDFERGVESHHNKKMYNDFCKRQNLVMIQKCSLFNAEMYKYCVQYLPKDRWNDPEKSARPKFLIRSSTIAEMMIKNFNEFMEEYEDSNYKAMKLFDMFHSKEVKLDRLHLSRRCFYHEYKLFKSKEAAPDEDIDDVEENNSDSDTDSSSST